MSRDDQSSAADSVSSPGGRPSTSGHRVARGETRALDAADPDLHHHVALLYEEQDDQFAAVVPMVRDALDRGDRCLYIYDDNAKADVVAAMRDEGIDVQAAVAAGDLSFHSKHESFLQDGSFDPSATIDFATEAVSDATQGGDYDAVLVTGEMTGLLDGGRGVDALVEYERALSGVFGTRPVVGVCQYNVTRFDTELLNQIIRVHPNLVYGSALASDFFYIPSEEVTGGGRSDEADDERRQTLLDRVTAYERLERREQALSALNDATQELMCLDADALRERAADLAREVLATTFVSVWSYDEASGELEEQSRSTERDDVTALSERFRDNAWEAFVSEQTRVCEGSLCTAWYEPPSAETESSPESESSPAELQSGVIVPLGRHGVFCAASGRPDAFDDPTVELATTLGANIEAAFDRAERERTLAEKNDQLERLNRINRVIREIGEALVETDTREDIERIVCERLAASDPYQFAWVGEQDVETETIEPRAWAGDANEYLDAVTITTREDEPTGRGPVSEALRTQTVQTVQDVLVDPAFDPWRETAHRHGFRACISLPLVHDELFYGVLTLYADAPSVFDEMEQAVLGELAEMIAHSIDAAAAKETLRADGVVELTFTVSDETDLLACLARETDSEVRFEGLVGNPDDGARLFFTAPGATVADVVSAAEQLTGISEFQVLRDETAEPVFKASVTESTLPARIVDNQAIVRSLTATADETTAVVDLPSTTEVREFLNGLRSRYPGLGLVARQNRNRSVKTGQGLREAVAERLTDRQWEVLKTAYLSGFFESPRVRTGKELADELDLAQSTLAHHLRGAERALLEMVFGND